MDLEKITLSEIRSKSQKDKTEWFYSHEICEIVELIEAENRMVAARGWGEEGNGKLFNGYKATVVRDK